MSHFANLYDILIQEQCKWKGPDNIPFPYIIVCDVGKSDWIGVNIATYFFIRFEVYRKVSPQFQYSS